MANSLVGIFRVKELRERVFFTFIMLVVFRIGTVLPVPGINVHDLNIYFQSQQNSGNAFVDYLDFFAGGAFSKLLGVYAGYHAVHLHVDHYAAFAYCVSQLKKIVPGRRRQKEDTYVSAVWYRSGLSYSVFCGNPVRPEHITLSEHGTPIDVAARAVLLVGYAGGDGRHFVADVDGRADN